MRVIAAPEQVEQVGRRHSEALIAIVTDQTRALEAAATKLEQTFQDILVSKVTEFDRGAADTRADQERASSQHSSRMEEALDRLSAAEVRATEVVGELVRTGATQSKSLDEQAGTLAARFEQTASEYLEQLQGLVERTMEVAAEPSRPAGAVASPALDVESVERATEFAMGGALDELIAARIVEVEQMAAAQVRALEEAGAAQSRSLAQTAAATSAAQAQAFEQAAAAALASQAGVMEQAATATSLTQSRMLESTAASARGRARAARRGAVRRPPGARGLDRGSREGRDGRGCPSWRRAAGRSTAPPTSGCASSSVSVRSARSCCVS